MNLATTSSHPESCKRKLLILASKERALGVLTLLLGLHALHSWFVGFHHTISDQHGFRQAQTALATQTILEGSPLLLYNLPVFGPPWAFPQEFPFYQWLTALLAAAGIPLIEAGRTLSISCFLLSLVALWKVLESLRVERGARLAITSLILSCPLYLFWTRTFLIETCALALSLWYVYFALQAVTARGRLALGSGAVLGILAVMVKFTTFLPFWAFVAFWLFAGARRRFIGASSFVMPGGALLAGPIVAGCAWTELASHVNQENALLASFYFPRALIVLVFGTLSDRLSPALWTAVSNRMLPDTIGTVLAVPLLFGLLPAVKRYGRHFLIAGALFLLPIVVFPNLHQIHNYYQTGNALFLNTAGGFIAYGLICRRGIPCLAGFVMLVLLVSSGIVRYYGVYFPSANTDNQVPLEIGREVQRLTDAGQIIAVRGVDWSPEIPFYSQRRAIMDREFTEVLLRHQVRAVSPARLGDVLFCYEARKQSEGLDLSGQLDVIRKRYGVIMKSGLDDGQCIHYTRAEVVPGISLGPLPYASALDQPKSGSVVRGIVPVKGWALSVPKVAEIRVEIDGLTAGIGKLGAFRPDLAKVFPQYPGHPFNGFALRVNTAGLASGAHSLRVEAVLEDRSQHIVGSATISAR